MKNSDDKVPVFFCDTWINEQGYLKKYRSESCKSQCNNCMDKIINYHFDKKEQLTDKPNPLIMDQYFKRGNQYWKIKGENILLINLKEKGHHYDGDAHIFLNGKQFDQQYCIKITKKEFEEVRDSHLKRLTEF